MQASERNHMQRKIYTQFFDTLKDVIMVLTSSKLLIYY